MAPDDTHQVTGRIVAVQEERFRLMTDEGQTLLLSLPRLSRVGPNDLKRWHASQQRVRAVYTGRPNLVSGVVRSIEPLHNGHLA